MTNLQIFLGSPVNFRDICFIYPPTVQQLIDNPEYVIYQKILTISQEEIYDAEDKEELAKSQQFTVPIPDGGTPQPLKKKVKKVSEVNTPLEYLLINCYHDKMFLKLTQKAFDFFTHNDILPLYDQKAFYIGDLNKITEYKSFEEMPLLKASNFIEFQNVIRETLGMEKIDVPNPNEDPRITRMKAKARYRDKIKAKNGQSLNFETIITSICCMGIGITPLNIGELSYGAISVLLNRMQMKEKYELDTSSILAGADSKKIKPKYWITNLNE